mmetsp:Transcript_39950/g.72000  ORF Transcript_39950/g.72000 Transcript_39950/m.72000 type:complete len:124 (-) Transcript_39950:28-399(-)
MTQIRPTQISFNITTLIFPRRGLTQSGLIRSTALFGPDLTYATANKTYRMILRHAKRSWCITERMPNARRMRCNPKRRNLNDTKTYTKETWDLADEKKELCDKNEGLHGLNARLHVVTSDLMQ